MQKSQGKVLLIANKTLHHLWKKIHKILEKVVLQVRKAFFNLRIINQKINWLMLQKMFQKKAKWVKKLNSQSIHQVHCVK